TISTPTPGTPSQGAGGSHGSPGLFAGLRGAATQLAQPTVLVAAAVGAAVLSALVLAGRRPRRHRAKAPRARPATRAASSKAPTPPKTVVARPTVRPVAPAVRSVRPAARPVSVAYAARSSRVGYSTVRSANRYGYRER
ncbi:MAG: hypothetical protein L3J72_01950, partial [Thermoplasmata archaeon]|nr:hypothetical protein [Thermoplasmata archaeon]